MKLVVDTNIVFSAILNSSGNIAKILYHAGVNYEFYSCDFLKHELALHKTKILKLTKLSQDECQELIDLVTSKITFIDERLLPKESWQTAFDLIGQVDEKDMPFVALSSTLKAHLWTGDKVLYRALTKKNYKLVINTTDLLAKIRN
jgi:predicted nucleic acid-binding protein